MQIPLAAMWQRARSPRRREVVLRPVTIPATFASDLLATAYAPVSDLWAASVDALLAEYRRSLAEITTDSAEGIGQILANTESQAAGLFVMIRPRLSAWAARLELFHRRRWRGAVLNATGVDLATMLGAGEVRAPLASVIERNVGLVRLISEQARTRIGEAVFRGLNNRSPADTVAREIREAVDMSRRRARNVAADQTVKLTAALNDERRRQAGLTTWEWVSSHKLHPRPEHARRDGKRYDDNAKSGQYKPPEDRPGQLPYCGCTARAVLTLEGEF